MAWSPRTTELPRDTRFLFDSKESLVHHWRDAELREGQCKGAEFGAKLAAETVTKIAMKGTLVAI